MVGIGQIDKVNESDSQGCGIRTWTSCLDAEKLLLILPISPMLKVDESTG